MIALLLIAGLMAPAAQPWTPKLLKSTAGVPVVQLEITRCMIPAAEVDPLPLAAPDAKRCERLNRASLGARTLRKMRLIEGTYVFRVTNKDVPWRIDFAVKGAHDRSLPKAAGGSLKMGQIAEYTIDLKRGVYVFSSPLGGTIDYPLLVEEAPRRRGGR